MARGSGKSGIELSQEHVDALVRFLEENRGKPLARYGVELNKTLIARCCGFDRQVFRTNPRCAELLMQADQIDRKSHLPKVEQAEAVREQKGKVEAEQQALEEQNLRLMVENAALRREIERWRGLSAIMAQSGRLP